VTVGLALGQAVRRARSMMMEKMGTDKRRWSGMAHLTESDAISLTGRVNSTI